MAWDRGDPETEILDKPLEELVEWTKPKWYEKLPIIIVFGTIAYLSAQNGLLGAILGIATFIVWYFVLTETIRIIKTRILTRKIRKAAEKRYIAKYALPRFFKKHPWAYEYMKAMRRAEELGMPYVPEIIIKDPATCEVEIRTPPPEDWTIPIRSIQQTTREQERVETPERPTETEATPEEEQRETTPIGEQRIPEERQTPQRAPREERRKTTGIDQLIDSFVDELSIEETHNLFRIMAEEKGYGRLKQELVVGQFIGITRWTLQRYMRGEMPTTPKRVATMQENIIKPTLKRDLKAQPQTLINVLTRFAEEHTRHTEKIQQIIQEMIRRPETGEMTEETTESQTQNNQQ